MRSIWRELAPIFLANLLVLSVLILTGAVDGSVRYIGGMLYKAAPSTLADGERDEFRCTNAGLLRVAVDGGSGSSVTADTELSAAASLVNNTATGSRTVLGAAMLAFDGNTLDLVTNGNGTAATAARVTLASDSTGVIALTTSTASIGKLAANSGVDIGDVDVTSITAPTDATKTTYHCATIALAPAASATDIFTITGSGTKTVKVRRLQIGGIATSAGAYTVALLLRSTADSGGTSTNEVEVKGDSTNAAATATVLSYTANPTTGTLVGAIRAQRITVTTAVGAIPIVPTVFDFTNVNDQAVTLRGTSEVLAVNLNAVTMTGGSLDIYVEWTEE